MNFDMNLIDQISRSRTKDLWDACFNPPGCCLKLFLGSCMVFSLGFPARMFSGAEKDYTALCIMCVCALLLRFQSYELNQTFILVVVLTVSDFIVFPLFCSVVKNGIQHFSLKDLQGRRVCLFANREYRKTLTSSTLHFWPSYKGTP